MSIFVTYAIRLPKADEEKREFNNGVRILTYKHGGEVTGVSKENKKTDRFITYAIRLPEAEEAKSEIDKGVRMLADKHGGEITGVFIYNKVIVLKRPSGFYRVKEDNKWTIAQYDSCVDVWASVGEGGDCSDEDWDEIEQGPIEMPLHD